jgi:hypothetical protein
MLRKTTAGLLLQEDSAIYTQTSNIARAMHVAISPKFSKMRSY